jgi:adenylyl- and sulfurtransferase ThiI
MRRFIVWATVASGVVAAYLMLRRGAPVTEVALKSVGNPVGSLVNELKTAS